MLNFVVSEGFLSEIMQSMEVKIQWKCVCTKVVSNIFTVYTRY